LHPLGLLRMFPSSLTLVEVLIDGYEQGI